MTEAKKTASKKSTKTETPNVFGFDAFSKMFEKAPSFDMPAVMDFQRKNVEALVEANRVMFDCAKAVASKQADFAKTVAADMNEKAVKTFQNEAPEFNINKSVEDFQAGVKTLGENAREVTDMTTEAGQKAFAVMQERYQESVEEIKEAAKI